MIIIMIIISRGDPSSVEIICQLFSFFGIPNFFGLCNGQTDYMPTFCSNPNPIPNPIPNPNPNPIPNPIPNPN